MTPKFLSYRRWLAADARNRVVRTILQGVAATIVVPALDAGLQVVNDAVGGAITGHGFDWRQVGMSALLAAVTTATMAIAAYLHRVKLDPSGLPSAAPPPAPVTGATPASSDPPVAPGGVIRRDGPTVV